MRLTKSPRERFLAKAERTPGCWWWRGAKDSRSGYGSLWDNDLKRPEKAHRMAYRLFLGTIPAGMEVCHSCDQPSCVNPAHLFLGTKTENMQDAVKKGRNAWGERQGSSRLTDGAVATIREENPKGTNQHRALARRYGVSLRTVYRVTRRETWRGLLPENLADAVRVIDAAAGEAE